MKIYCHSISTGNGIKIRSRRPANPNQTGHQGMAAHGKAFRRIRLQTSLHAGSSMKADGKSVSANGSLDAKAEMSESIKDAEFETPTPNRAAKMALFCSSDNDDNTPSWNADDAASSLKLKCPSSDNYHTRNTILGLRTKQPSDFFVKPQSPPLQKAHKASACFGRVTVVIPVILCVFCIGIGWFFGSR